jgi:putative FmdB family regulatory protein
VPLYAYTCTACGHSFDIHQSFSDDALTVCPECEGRLRKVFSPVGVVFKGSGFYRTDNKSTKKPGSAASKSESAPSNASSSDSSTSSPPSPSSGSESSSSNSPTSSSAPAATPAKAATPSS